MVLLWLCVWSLLASDIHWREDCKLMEIALWALCKSLRQVELQNLNKNKLTLLMLL